MNEWKTGTIEISIGGEPVEMQLTVPAKPVKLARMLPIFQQMTDSFVDFGVRRAENEGRQISCQAGCGACCRQLVPLAEAETDLIGELVESLPEPRRTNVKKRFADACRHFYEIGWFERVDACENLSNEELQRLGDDYFAEKIPCPFLEEESCSIHSNRPLACREYLVTSPAVNCLDPTPETIEKVELLFMLSDTLLNVENKNNRKPINFVPLIFAPVFAARNAQNLTEKTGEEWTAEFFRELSKASGEQ